MDKELEALSEVMISVKDELQIKMREIIKEILNRHIDNDGMAGTAASVGVITGIGAELALLIAASNMEAHHFEDFITTLREAVAEQKEENKVTFSHKHQTLQ